MHRRAASRSIWGSSFETRPLLGIRVTRCGLSAYSFLVWSPGFFKSTGVIFMSMRMIFNFGFARKKYFFAEIWHDLDWRVTQKLLPRQIFLCKMKIPFVTVYKGNLDFTKGNCRGTTFWMALQYLKHTGSPRRIIFWGKSKNKNYPHRREKHPCAIIFWWYSFEFLWWP